MKFLNIAFFVSFIWVFEILRNGCFVQSSVNENIRDSETGGKCEVEAKKLTEEKHKLENNLQKCQDDNRNQSSKYKAENGELRNKINALEELLKENKASVGKSTTCSGNVTYLMSYDILKNHLIKIYKIYKTIYFVLVEKTILASVFSKGKEMKDKVLIEIKINRALLYEQCKKGISMILQMNSVQKGVEAFNKLKKHKIAIVTIQYTYDTYETVKNSLYMGYNIIIPKLYTLKDNANMILQVVNMKLQKNSDQLLEQLYLVNPEMKGIIPEKLTDQFILLLFFLVIHMLFLYLFIYFFFVIFRILRFVCLFLVRLVRSVISAFFRSVIFVVTIPIRPFMKKKANKNRKVYKPHADNLYNNQDRGNYQQTEFKKMNKNQYTKHRK